MSLESAFVCFLINFVDQMFNLKFTSKQMARMSKKSEKNEKQQKLKLKQVGFPFVKRLRQ